MTEQEQFEQWWCSFRESFTLDIDSARRAWQAAKQDSAAEIESCKAAHKAALDEKEQARHDEELSHNYIQQLKAKNLKLREIFEELKKELK